MVDLSDAPGYNVELVGLTPKYSTGGIGGQLGAPTPEPVFEPFPSIRRLKRGMVITEKLDGTNGQVYVGEDGRVLAGSRNRWLKVSDVKSDDNFGFARWVQQHEDELRTGLGPGRHYGEWWGVGIGRGYDLHERRFSLFNTARWADAAVRPACCGVVPVLYEGDFDTGVVDTVMAELALLGSKAAPGYLRPEGVIVYHQASRTLFKRTLEQDEAGKGRES